MNHDIRVTNVIRDNNLKAFTEQFDNGMRPGYVQDRQLPVLCFSLRDHVKSIYARDNRLK